MPEGSIEQVSEGWQRLRSEAPATSDFEIPSLTIPVQTGFGKLRLASGPHGEARLLIPISEQSPMPDVPDLRALQMRVQRFTGSGGSTRFIDLICLERQLDTVFAELVQYVVGKVEAGSTGREACEDAILDFKALLDSVSEKTKDISVVRGLVGELMLLERLATISAAAVDLWRGPIGDRHDFRGGVIAIEAKASSRITNPIKVSSFEQMISPTDGELYLYNVVLEGAAGGSHSVQNLCDKIIKRSGDRKQLAAVLSKLGCEDFAAPEWNAHRFNLEAERAFRVAENFPRLLPEDFIDGFPTKGVSKLTYEIDLSCAREFELDPSEFGHVLKRIAGCL